MNFIITILCALLNHATSQTDDFSPARILAHQKMISEKSDLELTCSTYGKKTIQVYVYLCKDDVAHDERLQKSDQTDTTFLIRTVNQAHSGNYSCVYSLRNHSSSKVTKRGHNILQILVIDISVPGPSSVREGEDVEFRCTLSVALQTLRECQLIHSYLRKNDSILQVETFDVTKMEATFTIQGAAMRDSGHYSCVVLPSSCVQEHEEIIRGNNAVLLEVKAGHSGTIISAVMITAGIILVLCLWWINKHGPALALCNQSAESELADSDMLEEQQEQQEQEEASDLETQDDNSFSSVEDEQYVHGMVAREAERPEDDEDGLYSVVDEPRGHQYVYATSFKMKNRQLL